jgi:hypothetical protein
MAKRTRYIDAEPAGKAPRRKREPRITELVDRACRLVANGDAKGVTDCAEKLGCARTYLSRALGRSHVKKHLAEMASLDVSLALTYATRVKIQLLAASSEAVRSDVASEIMAINGIAPPRGGGITINNTNVQQAGYVINLSEPGDEIGHQPVRLLEAEPEERLPMSHFHRVV